TSFESVAAVRNTEAYLEIGANRSVRLGTVSTNFFSMLGVKPQSGRLFSPQEEANTSATAVLSHTAWQRDFAADPLVLGKSITVQDQYGRERYVVIGILPATFAFAEYGMDTNPSPDIWISTSVSNHPDADFNLIATLKKGIPVSDAEREAAVIFDSGLDAEA